MYFVPEPPQLSHPIVPMPPQAKHAPRALGSFDAIRKRQKGKISTSTVLARLNVSQE